MDQLKCTLSVEFIRVNGYKYLGFCIFIFYILIIFYQNIYLKFLFWWLKTKKKTNKERYILWDELIINVNNI